MGVVRKEGQWRLEKAAEGVYEVTYDREAEVKIITSDYTPQGFNDERQDFAIPVREVDSFTQAEDEFYAIADEGSTDRGFGIGIDTGLGGSNSQSTQEPIESNGDFEDVPAVAVILGALIVGSYLISTAGIDLNSSSFLLGVTFVIVGIGGISWTYLIYRSDGISEATSFLISTDDSDTTETFDNSSEKTPPVPEKLKGDLIFGRANQRCEWCEKTTDTPEVHHIEPRSEGGPNTRRNLIVLCPDCHRKADNGTPSKTKLKQKVKRIEQEVAEV